MIKRKKPIEEAYAGQYLKYRGVTYSLIPEKEDKQCTGCAVLDKNPRGCNSNLTDYCRQGFILKEINI